VVVALRIPVLLDCRKPFQPYHNKHVPLHTGSHASCMAGRGGVNSFFFSPAHGTRRGAARARAAAWPWPPPAIKCHRDLSRVSKGSVKVSTGFSTFKGWNTQHSPARRPRPATAPPGSGISTASLTVKRDFNTSTCPLLFNSTGMSKGSLQFNRDLNRVL
jgi:hypothetical protein